MARAVHACECETCQGDESYQDRARHAEGDKNEVMTRMVSKTLRLASESRREIL